MEKAKKIEKFVHLSNFTFGILLFPSLYLCLMSIMMFDSPGSSDNVYLKMLVYSIWSFPLMVILSRWASKDYYKTQKYKEALVAALLPLISIVAYVIFSYLLDVKCNGRFVC